MLALLEASWVDTYNYFSTTELCVKAHLKYRCSEGGQVNWQSKPAPLSKQVTQFA